MGSRWGKHSDRESLGFYRSLLPVGREGDDSASTVEESCFLFSLSL